MKIIAHMLLCFLFVCSVLSTSSCSKKKDDQQDFTFVLAHSLLMRHAYDVASLSSIALKQEAGSTVGYMSVPDGMTFSKGVDEFSLDYGLTNILCPDGRNRRGKLVATKSILNSDPLSYTVEMVNFYVNDKKIEGTIALYVDTGIESRTSVNPDINIKYDNGITYSTTGGFDLNAGFMNENYTLYFEPEFFKQSNLSGYYRILGIYDEVTTGHDCSYFGTGKITFIIDDKEYKIDYGINNNCDNQAIVTDKQGKMSVVTLP